MLQSYLNAKNDATWLQRVDSLDSNDILSSVMETLPVTSPSHGGGREFESRRAHWKSPIRTRTGLDWEKASWMRVYITLEALLPVFFRSFMVSFDKVR